MYFYIGFFSTHIFQILHITFVFRFSFPRASLYPVYSLSKTPLNRHRNVYVELTPQSGQPLKTIRIFWSHRWTVYRSFSLYIIYILKMCILFGIGIRTNFRVVELSLILTVNTMLNLWFTVRIRLCPLMSSLPVICPRSGVLLVNSGY
jgi:hypothetical protein